MTVECDRCSSRVCRKDIRYYEVNKVHYGHYCNECAKDLNLKK